MRRTSTQVFTLLLTLAVTALFGQTTTISQPRMDSLDGVRIGYISRYKQLAINEMQRSGVPASITLAQGILESSSGGSFLAKNANNHFGTKCGDRWTGATAFKHDDEFDRQGQAMHSCFRSYDDPSESFSDHSDFLRDPQKANRYGGLFDLDPLDYRAWAEGLQAAGYSPVGHYSARLIEYIERYRLHELDYQTWQSPTATPLQRVMTVNGAAMLHAQEGETVSDIARLFRLPVATLLAYNDQGYTATEALSYGAPVFLEIKPNTWQQSDLEFYFVHDGKTMFDVAQLFGIQTSALRALNGLTERDEPAMEAKIRVQGKRKAGEKVALRTRPIARKAVVRVRNNKPPLEPLASEYPMAPANRRALDQTLHGKSAPLTSRVVAAPPATPVVTNTAPAAPAQFEITLGSVTYHDVAFGDTLMSLSRRYGTTPDEIRRLNGLSGDGIRAGQRLRVK